MKGQMIVTMVLMMLSLMTVRKAIMIPGMMLYMAMNLRMRTTLMTTGDAMKTNDTEVMTGNPT